MILKKYLRFFSLLGLGGCLVAFLPMFGCSKTNSETARSGAVPVSAGSGAEKGVAPPHESPMMARSKKMRTGN